MSAAIGQITSVRAQHAQDRRANFVPLVSTVNRDNNAGTKGAFDALIELAPKTPRPTRKGMMEAMREAIETMNLEAAREALRELQQSRMAKVDASAENLATQKACLTCGTSINILA